MFTLSKPAKSEIDRFIDHSNGSGFTYRHIGKTKGRGVSRGFKSDRNRKIIGRGEEDFERARRALRQWKMFDMPWVELCWPDTPIEVGRTVAVLVEHFGFYSLNAAKIVYVIDKWNQFGFAYGTLARHVESGEERFIVEMDAETGEVWYELFAFSRPNYLLTRLAYPLTRSLQKRFARDSMAAMLRAMRDK